MFQPGDVLLFDTNGAIQDRLITLVSRSTHAAMMINSSVYIEATFPRVKRTPLKSGLTNFRAYRPPDDFTVDQKINMIQLLLTFEHDKYSITQGVIAGILRLFGLIEHANRFDRNWNCSEFIAFGIRHGAGVSFLPNMAMQSVLPSDVEQELINSDWRLIL